MTDFTLWQVCYNLLLAARWTVVLSVVAFIGGGALGFLVLLLRIAKRAPIRLIAKLFIELFQGTPLLMQLFLAFFGIALFGIDVPAWLAAGVALILWSSSYLAEIWRGSVQAVSKGQWEAASCLAIGRYQTLFRIILPQAFLLSVPSTVGFMVQIVKGTALTSIIGFVDLLKAGTIITNITFSPFEVYGMVALIYFAICWPLALLSFHLERRLNGSHQN